MFFQAKHQLKGTIWLVYCMCVCFRENQPWYNGSPLLHAGMGRLVELQKRPVRIITWSKYAAHTDLLFKSTEILKVANILNPKALPIFMGNNNHTFEVSF